MQQIQWKGRTGGGKGGQQALLFLFRYFPIRFGYLLLRGVIPFYLLFAVKGRRAIYSYFRERWGYSVWKSWRKTYRNHYLFGQTLMDKFAVFAGKGEWFQVEISGYEFFEQALETGKGIIFASSHVGNFEMTGYLLKNSQRRINSIIFGNEATTMQAYRDQAFHSNAINLIPVTDDISHIFHIHNALSNKEIISLPCDRFFSGKKSLKTTFLGAEAIFPTGAFHLAERFDAEVLALFAIKASNRRYHIHILPVRAGESDRKVEVLARQFVDRLEEILRKHPEQWFNFYQFWENNERKA